jgi:hypothetical protein
LLRLDRVEEAAFDLQQAALLNPLSAQPLSMLAAVAARAHATSSASSRHARASSGSRRPIWWSRGSPDALDGLERAYDDRDPRLTFLAVDTKWDAVQTDPPRPAALRADGPHAAEVDLLGRSQLSFSSFSAPVGSAQRAGRGGSCALLVDSAVEIR